MKTHSNCGSARGHCGVRTLHPAWGMRTAVVFIDTGGRHLVASISEESVPSRSQGFVTLSWFVLVVNHSSVSVREDRIARTF